MKKFEEGKRYYSPAGIITVTDVFNKIPTYDSKALIYEDEERNVYGAIVFETKDGEYFHIYRGTIWAYNEMKAK